MAKAKPKRESFSDYLTQFSRQEKEQAFGKEAYDLYRRGKITPAQMKRQKASMKMLESFRAMEPRLDMDMDKYERMGMEAGRAAGEKMKRDAANRIAERLGLPPVGAATAAATDAVRAAERVPSSAKEEAAAYLKQNLADAVARNAARLPERLALPPLGATDEADKGAGAGGPAAT
jgi:hypothetical protein